MSFFKRKHEHQREDSSSTPAEIKQAQPISNGARDSPRTLARPTSTSSPPVARLTADGTNRLPAAARIMGESPMNNGRTIPSASGNLLNKTPISTMPSYPWSTRQLVLSASTLVGAPPNTLVSPFPRYGLSVPPIPTQSGHLLIFGGLVRESVRNDLFALDCQDFSAASVAATGDFPLPRVGHASALVRSVLLVWGGDTKSHIDDEQDEAIYLFNIHTREWTRILAPDSRPKGRYGHAVCMHGNVFYVSGGQVDGYFMNDLWGFDLSTLMASPTWHQIQPANQAPPSRTGHVIVNHQDKLYIFGGTDGSYHYNDTWCLDLSTRQWTELQCIGYIPVPREGHSAAMVDDVMYVFGGRDVNGKDLGDLAAFKVTNRRWYTFQNMGPAPSGRSGHAMSASGKQIFVLGGESNAAFAQSRTEDPNIIHVLDTAKIKYPADPPRNAEMPQAERENPNNAESQAQRAIEPSELAHSPSSAAHVHESQHVRNDSTVTRGLQNGTSRAEIEKPVVKDLAEQPYNGHVVQNTRQESPTKLATAFEPIVPLSAEPARKEVTAPQRPRRAGDEVFAQNLAARSLSPSQRPDQHISDANNMSNLSVEGRTVTASPTLGVEDHRRPGTTGLSKAPPADAFYYGTRSPTGTIFSTRAETPSQTVPSRNDDYDNQAIRENAIYRGLIEHAFSNGLSIDSESVPRTTNVDSVENPDVLLEEILDLQAKCSKIKSDLITKATTVADEYAQSENLRDSAIQEAAYLRARMAILEGDNSSSNEEPSHERVREMEDYLAETERTKKALETRTSELTSEIDRLSSQIDTLNVADADAMKRADKAEEAEYKIRSELHAAQDRLALLDTELREHASRIVALSSNVQQRETELQEHKTNLKKLENDHDDRLHDMEKLQAALQSAEQRAQTASESLASLQIRVEEVERELGDARVEVLKRSQEAEQSAKRIAIIEPELKSLESKLHTYRELADGRLGQVATSRNGGTQVESFAGLPDKMSPIAQECASLRKMLNEAGLQIESAQSNLMTQRTAIEEHTKQNLELQSELRQAQARSAKDAAIVAAMTTTLAVREDQHRRHGEAIMELQARCAMMRNLLADHNIAIHDVPEAANALKHSADNDYRRELEEARSELAQLRQHVQNTQARAIVPDGEKAKAIDSEDARVAVLETRLVESEAAHKKKLSQVETDYQTAVRYVKGTEKVFRRMKDELNKQKSMNATLQAELDAVQGTNGAEAGSRTRAATSGRATPTADPEGSRQQQRVLAHNTELQQQLEGAREELDALRDVCTGREREVEIMRKRATDTEARLSEAKKELERLQNTLSDGRTLDDLEQENAELRQENETLNHQVMLLLADDDVSSPRPKSGLDFGKVVRRRSASSTVDSEDHGRDLTLEMQEWQHNFSPRIGST